MRMSRNGGSMRKVIIILVISLLALTGCNIENSITSDKLVIVTTLFPQYDIAKQITKDKADVILMLPPGVEAHSYEPTPKDMVTVSHSDLFIYTSNHLESYASSISKSVSKELNVMNLEKVLNVETEDPHFWLDPMEMIKMTEIICEEIIALDPVNTDFYEKNTNEYIEKLHKLDRDMQEMFKDSSNDTIVFAGHFAFEYFADRYGLNYITPFESFSANAEASVKKVYELIDYINDKNISVVYFEELVDPKLANMIASETNTETLMLHAAHNVSKEELRKEVSYIDIMYQNLDNLKRGLNDE